MGKRGPQPTPTTVLEQRGSWLVRNRGDEPEPAEGVPDCPEWLQGEAREKWFERCGVLSEMGVLTVADGDLLAAYCEAWVEMIEALEEIAREGATAVSDKGSVYQHPAVGRKNKAIERLVKIGSHFGMSPSSRVGLKAEKKPPADPLTDMLKKRGSNN